jgi:hypothetical protein
LQVVDTDSEHFRNAPGYKEDGDDLEDLYKFLDRAKITELVHLFS